MSADEADSAGDRAGGGAHLRELPAPARTPRRWRTCSVLAPGAPPVYLWGPPGSGKTHLLHAVVERAQQQGASIAWFEAAVPAPWQAPEHCDWIAPRRLPGARRRAAAGRLRACSSTPARRARSSLAAGSVPPVDLPLREDLRTRLGWGHVFPLQPLTEPEVPRRAAARGRSARHLPDRRGDGLPADPLRPRPQHLMALLDRLDEFSLATKRAITVPLLKQMLAEEDE